MSEKVTLTTVTRKGAIELKLKGGLLLYNAETFATELGHLLKKQPQKIIGLNLAELTGIDSSGLAALVRVLKQALENGRNVQLFAANEKVERVFKATGLDSFFKFVEQRRFETDFHLQNDLDDFIDNI